MSDASDLIITNHCKTASDFITALSPRGPSYSSAFPRGWIFRGHSDDTYRLVPSALRNDSKELLELTLGRISNNKEQYWAENRALGDFLEVSDSIGLHVPEDTQKLRRSFELGIKPPTIWPPDEVLSLMALAQHHGVPTRLFDWSRHPLKAALFAAFDASEAKDKGRRLSVWALSIEKLEMIDSENRPFTVITAPSATNSNLRAQEGIFTLAKHIKPDDLSVDRTPFDEILRTWVETKNVRSPGPWFHHVTLPQTEAEQLCFDLALEGITRATLFPDFYGVVKAMKDAARWQRNNGPGAKRTKKHLDSFVISYEATIDIRELQQKLRKPPASA